VSGGGAEKANGTGKGEKARHRDGVTKTEDKMPGYMGEMP